MIDDNKIILKASAGTGKTYRLSLEFIGNLIKGINYKEIIVMTFTKKATAEIKERIYDFLYQIAFNEGNGKELEQNLKEIFKFSNSDINKEKLQEIYFEMIKNKEEIRIYTIDGFTNKIFKSAIAPSLGVYSFETLDTEEEEFYGEILTKILNNKKLYEKFQFIIEEKQDKKNINTYIDFIKNMMYLQKEYLLCKNFENNKKNTTNIIFLEDIIKTFENIDSERKSKKKEDDNGFFTKEFYPIYEKFKEIDEMIKKDKIENTREKIAFIENNWELFFGKTVEDSKNIWNGQKIRNTDKNKEVLNTLEELKKSYLKSLSNYLYVKKVIPLHEKLKDFSEELYKLVEKMKISSKRFTHDDISTYTYKFIYDEKLKFIEDGKINDNFFDLIGGKVKTIMIDEFQDTSILQWKILNILISTAENIICVGDEKQSIYSWRGGEKELFENLENIIGGKVENLEKSYRSYKEIIENVNKIYKEYRNDWKYTEVSYREDEEYQKGYFEYNFKELSSKNSSEEIENNKNYEKIIEMIKEKKVKNLGNSCIICRTNGHLNEIVNRLNDENIPYTLNSNASILEHGAINPIYKLIKYFLYNNSIYFLEFLRSDLIGCLNDHVGYYLENKNDIEIFINSSKIDNFKDFINESENKNNLIEYEKINYLERNKREFSEILNKVKKLKYLSKNLNSIYLKENFSKEIIEAFELIKYYSTNSDLKNIFNFFNILKEHTNLFDFINFIEEKKEKLTQLSSEDLDAINLMTTHKSKGLEFDTVFYYKRDANNDGSREKELNCYIKYDNKYENIEDFLVVMKKYNKIFIEGKYYEYKKEIERKNEIEETNGDYVALTRAKKNLIILFDIIINKNGEYKNELVKKIIEKYPPDNENKQFFTGEIIEKEKKVKNNDINDYSHLDNILHYFSENKAKYDNNKNTIDLNGEFKRKKGLAIHYYLEHLTNNLEEDKKIAKSAYLNRYGNMLGKKTLEKLHKRIENFINKNKSIYDPQFKVYTEFEIYDENGDKKIIDRINIDEKNKKIYIYDYKTGYEPHENDKYKEQIYNYKKIIEKEIKGEYEVIADLLEI